MKTFVRLIAPVLIAVVLGPLVAGLVFCALAVVTNVLDPATATPLADLLKMFAIYIAVAYFQGAPIAFLAGLLMSIWMIRRPPGIVPAVVAAIAAVGLFWLAADAEWLRPIGGGMVRNNLALTLAVGAVAAGACWLLTRRFGAMA
jgi:hypothetical protein